VDSSIAIPRDVVPSVVLLQSRIPPQHPSVAVLGDERLGTGVVVAPDRVLTASYLVLGAKTVEVMMPGGHKANAARVVLDHESGLALLFLDRNDLRAVPLGNPAGVVPGLPVFLISATGTRERKGATGHVLSVAPFEAFWEYMLDRAIMTTAINPGLAGAPLFDLSGSLIGVVSLGLVSVGRYTLAIGVEHYLEKRQDFEGGLSSRPQRAWIGFYPQAYDGGLLVTGVVPGGPAEKAGLEKGDLILSVDGENVSSLRGLYTAIWRHGPGETVGFQLLRETKILLVEVCASDRADFYK